MGSIHKVKAVTKLCVSLTLPLATGLWKRAGPCSADVGVSPGNSTGGMDIKDGKWPVYNH